MHRLRALAARLVRGPWAELIRADLEDLYQRDRARRVGAWRSHARFARRLAASVFSTSRLGPAQRHAPDRGWRRASRGGSMLDDVRFALRLFRRHPTPVIVAVVGLALAVGVATAIFSLVDATMLRPFGVDDPATVVRVVRPLDPRHGWGYARAVEMRSAAASLDTRLEASVDARVRFSAAAADEGRSDVSAMFVSGHYLEMLGGRPSVGRTLGAADDLPTAPPVVVVSDHFYRSVLGRDEALVGSTVWVNGVAATLIGVVSPSFTGPAIEPPGIWAPLAVFDEFGLGPAPGPDWRTPVDVVGRLGPSATRSAVQQRLDALVAQTDDADNADNAPAGSGDRLAVIGAGSPLDGPADLENVFVSLLVLALAGLILALACGNTANLLMAAAVTRRKEIGVRLALGATRGRLVRQVLTESVLLGLAAGAGGFMLAHWVVPVFASMAALPPTLDLAPNGRAFVFSSIIALTCGLAAGLSPARHGARGQLLPALQAGASQGSGVMPSRLRAGFVGLQAATSMLLLVLAMLLVRSAISMSRLEPGFDADRLLTISLRPVASGLDHAAYIRTAIAEVRAVPSVEMVSATRNPPFAGSVRRHTFLRDGRTYRLDVNYSDEAFLPTVGIPILRGRTFTANEVAREAPVALINAAAAHALFGEEDPVGQLLVNEPGRAEPEPATIVGIVGDAMLTAPGRESVGVIYRPLNRDPVSASYSNEGFVYPPGLVVRTSNPRATLAIEEAIRRIDPAVRPTVALLAVSIESFLEGPRRLAWLLGPPALLALALAALGVFGVVSFVANQRTGEVCVRMALGATSGDIWRMTMVDGLRPVVIGLVVGLGLALLAGQWLGSNFRLSSAHDPAAIAGAALLLLGSTLAAVAIPAARAARTEPAGLLRQG